MHGGDRLDGSETVGVAIRKISTNVERPNTFLVSRGAHRVLAINQRTRARENSRRYWRGRRSSSGVKEARPNGTTNVDEFTQRMVAFARRLDRIYARQRTIPVCLGVHYILSNSSSVIGRIYDTQRQVPLVLVFWLFIIFIDQTSDQRAPRPRVTDK